MSKYSRILLLNDDGFNDYSGGGITLKNLFQGWPIDKIAVAYWNNSMPIAQIAVNYYKLGYLESHFCFPLNYLSNEPRGNLNGPYTVTGTEHVVAEVDKQGEVVNKQPSANIIKKLFLRFITKTGLSELVHPLKASNEFITWVKEFKPEIIYCQCGDLGFVNLLLQTQKITGAKVVIHIMDDWPSTIYKDKGLSFILRPMVLSRFKKALKIAGLRLGISSAMASEFGKRYGLPFDYFHNPIDAERFSFQNKDIKKLGDPVLVVYAGRLGIASYHAIVAFSKCVEELRNEGVNIRFHVHTPLESPIITFSDFQHDGTFLLPSLKDVDFMEKLREADLLLYPVDFDQKSIEYIRLSFPTKLPSYLISGVPILCYGPSNVHSIQVMEQNGLGFVCTHEVPALLKSTLIRAIKNDNERRLFSLNAIRFAKNNFERKNVVKSFHEKINQITN